jgi:signal transduction histidine kinase
MLKMDFPTPTKEFERLLELSDLDLDYSNLEEELSDLVTLAAHVVGTKVSLINLIDSYTQWSVADYGLDTEQISREESVCQYTIMDDKPFEVNDLSKDERFADSGFVQKHPDLTYYLGVPLKTSRGANIGALCVLDSEQKKVSPEKERLLEMIANQVVRRLEAIKKINDLSKEIEVLQTKTKKVSHDMRNPLAGIIGIAELMEDEIKNKRVNELLDLAKMIKKGGNNLLELLESILEKEEEKSRKPANNEFSCESFCTKLNELYQPQAKTKGVKLNIETSEGSSQVVFPKSRLLQIVGNLITNSIKFTDKYGSVNVSIEVSTANTIYDNNLLIIVKDTGVGMKPEKVREILNGEAMSESGTKGEKGYGFGLALVHHLVKKANGQMEIQSEPGVGTEFNIKIPLNH